MDLTGIDKLGEAGVFIVLVIMLMIQFTKMVLEHRAKAPVSDDGIKKLVAEQIESYGQLMDTMEAYFTETHQMMTERGKKVDKLYDMHNVRRNGTLAWYPRSNAPLEKAIDKLSESMMRSADQQLELLRQVKGLQEKLCSELTR
jgi:hypothetical protein